MSGVLVSKRLWA